MPATRRIWLVALCGALAAPAAWAQAVLYANATAGSACSYTVPANVRTIQVEVAGAGGGGGGADNRLNTDPLTAGHGGNGGAGARITARINVLPGDVIACDVPAGGQGGLTRRTASSPPPITGGTGGTGRGAGGAGGSDSRTTVNFSGGGGGGGGAAFLSVGTTVLQAGAGAGGAGGSYRRVPLAQADIDAGASMASVAGCGAAGAGGNGEDAPTDGGGGGGGGGGRVGGAGGNHGVDSTMSASSGHAGSSCYFAGSRALLGTPAIAPAGGAGGLGRTNTTDNVRGTSGGNGSIRILDATRTVTVGKALSPTTDSGRFNLQVNGTTQATDVGHGGSTPAIPIAVGEAVSVAELAGTGPSLALYGTTLSCTGATPTPGAANQSGSFTMPDANVACTFTNTRATRNVTVHKALSPAADPGRFNLQVNGVTQAADVGDGGVTPAVSVNIGDAVTVAEQAGAATSLGLYTTTLSCTGAAPTPAAGNQSGSFTMPDADVTCTFSNVRAPAAPVPTTSTWLLGVMAIMLTALGARAMAARRRDPCQTEDS